jgi:glycosyltransferase involved in cell wall biosynthesis
VKILHVYKDYYPVLGGIENHIRVLAEAQVQQGHQVTVLVTNSGRQTSQATLNGVSVLKAGRLATVASTPLSLSLPLALRREQPDIAHLHFPYPMGDLAQAVFGRSRRMVITYHSDVVRQKTLLRFYAPLLRRTLDRADAIIATSPRYVETSPFLAPRAARCAVIPLGIDPARFETADPAAVAAIRVRYGERLVLFVGHLRYYKGVEYLVQAMSQLEARLLLAGDHSPKRRAEIESLAHELGVAERVTFVGEQDEAGLAAYYHACDVFALPCIERSEAFGVVQLDAMAAGRPVVACDVGTGVAWVNQHNVTGLIVPPRDARQLATALSQLLADPGLRARMGSAGRARVREQFTLAQMTERTRALYEQVLARPNRAKTL